MDATCAAEANVSSIVSRTVPPTLLSRTSVHPPSSFHIWPTTALTIISMVRPTPSFAESLETEVLQVFGSMRPSQSVASTLQMMWDITSPQESADPEPAPRKQASIDHC